MGRGQTGLTPAHPEWLALWVAPAPGAGPYVHTYYTGEYSLAPFARWRPVVGSVLAVTATAAPLGAASALFLPLAIGPLSLCDVNPRAKRVSELVGSCAGLGLAAAPAPVRRHCDWWRSSASLNAAHHAATQRNALPRSATRCHAAQRAAAAALFHAALHCRRAGAVL